MTNSKFPYHMYYAGCVDESEMIGVAMSHDLKKWWRPDTNPIIPRGPAGAFDEGQTSNPTVVETDDGLAMIYQAKDKYGVFRFGRARSTDGIHWTKDPQPVLSTIPLTETGNTSYREGIQHPHLVRLDDRWRLYFVECRGGKHAVRFAESDKLEDFEIQDHVCLRQELECESFSIYYPWIVRTDAGWFMWYSAVEARGKMRVWHVVRAVSKDGIEWTRDPARPLVSGGLPFTAKLSGRLVKRALQRLPRRYTDDMMRRKRFDSLQPINIANPSVVASPTGWTMYYHAALPDGGVSIGRFQSRDGIEWTDRDEMVLGDRPDGWEQDFNADPFLLTLKKTTKDDSVPSPEFLALKQLLDQVPIQRGDDLWVHSALRKVGGGKAQPNRIIEYLLERIGPEGTLLMPMFPMTGSSADYIASGVPFDPRKTPPAMGVLSNILFREYPMERSLYPWVSIGAVGKRAREYTATHHEDVWPMGKKSPFYKLYENGGKILLLGCGWERNSNLHIVESIRGDAYPYATFAKEPGVMQYVDRDGSLKPVYVKVPLPRKKTTDWNRWGDTLADEYGFQTKYAQGDLRCRFLDARGMLHAIEKGLDRGIYPYTSQFTPELRPTWPLIRLGILGRKAASRITRIVGGA